MLIEQINEFEDWRGLGPLVVHYSYSWLFLWENKNLWGKSSSGSLFTAKIRLEAMKRAFPYLGQLTCKI